MKSHHEKIIAASMEWKKPWASQSEQGDVVPAQARGRAARNERLCELEIARELRITEGAVKIDLHRLYLKFATNKGLRGLAVLARKPSSGRKSPFDGV
jgi:hypothetical protein